MDAYTAARLRHRRSSNALPLILGFGALLAVGGGVFYWVVVLDGLSDQPAPQVASPAPAPTPVAPAVAAPAEPSRAPAVAPPRTARLTRSNEPAAPRMADTNRASGGGSYSFASAPGGPPRDPAGAVDRIAKEVHDGLQLRKSLVVWLFDRSPSASPLREAVIPRVRDAWQALKDEVGDSQAAASADPGADPHDAAPLLTTVCAYSDQLDFLLQDPTDDMGVIGDALGRVQSTPSPIENTFGAILDATTRYLPYRLQKGRHVTIVVVSDEVGDDQQRADEVLAQLARYSIPVHVIGISTYFARADGAAHASEGGGDDPRLPLRVVQGPETRESDWLNLDYPGGGASLPEISTGLGPYMLSRLCQETGGTYYALPQMGDGLRSMTMMTSVAASSGPMDGSAGTNYWSAAAGSAESALPNFGNSSYSAGPVEANFIRRYMPRYVSEEDYRKDVAGNKAKQVLLEAARLPRIEVFTGGSISFSMTEDDARRQRAMDTAQRPAARVIGNIDAAYNILRGGESDRGKLTEPRWQAAFDLAIGRVMAAKVRADGYVNMIAVLKNGKPFENPNSTTWSVEPANELKAASALDRMSEKSREYLEGVIENHPGTPWAEAAQRELQSPIGWKLIER